MEGEEIENGSATFDSQEQADELFSKFSKQLGEGGASEAKADNLPSPGHVTTAELPQLPSEEQTKRQGHWSGLLSFLHREPPKAETPALKDMPVSTIEHQKGDFSTVIKSGTYTEGQTNIAAPKLEEAKR